MGLAVSCGPSGRLSRRTDAPAVTESVAADVGKIWDYSLSHPDGFTVETRTLSVPEDGISVAYSATQGMHSREDLPFVISHSLEHDGYIGGWLNSADSLYYFDSVMLFPESELKEALAFGRENGQEAVFILSSGKEVRLTKTVRPHQDEPAAGEGQVSVFLAGTIDDGAAEDWQSTVAGMLDGRETGYILFNPRQEDWHPEREGEMDYQVNWELEHMEKADFILMNFIPGSSSPITLLELGLYARSGKLLVICTPGYYRYDNVRITCSRYGVPLYLTLEDAVGALP